MITPSLEIILLLNAFAPSMTAPCFKNSLVLIFGAILAPGKRTVTSALKVLGIQDANFDKFHRVLSRNKWSPVEMSFILLDLLIRHFVPEGADLEFNLDETLERRQGKKIKWKAWYKDGVRSTGKNVVVSTGLRWLCLTILVKTPWCKRPWSLPFFVILVPSEKACARNNRPHRPGWKRAIFVMKRVKERYPDRKIHLCGDGGFAVVEFVRACQEIKISLTSRLRPDAGLYDYPSSQPSSKRGPKPLKGAKQMKLVDRLKSPKSLWTSGVALWYGQKELNVMYLEGRCLWYTPGQDPVPIHWVLIRYQEEGRKPGELVWKSASFFCSDLSPYITALKIINRYPTRWNIEVTFEEIRAHLGFETQRQWSDTAIERTTPCLFGLFSLIVLMAKALHPEKLPVCTSKWYQKEEATFSDALGAVRCHLWGKINNTNSPFEGDMRLIPATIWDHMVETLCRAA